MKKTIATLKSIRKISHVLPALMAVITQHERYQTKAGRDFEWTHASYVHDVFRLYEVIFWRRYGIRCENSVGMEYIDGKKIITKNFYTIEAGLVHMEGLVRIAIKEIARFRLPKLFPFRIHIPMAIFVTPIGQFGLPTSPYLFAVALDGTNTGNNNTGTSLSSFTWTQDCAGSNRFFASGWGVPLTDDRTSSTFDGVSCTNIQKAQTGGLTRWSYLDYLVGPHTGTALTFTGNFSQADPGLGASATYTGVASSLDGSNSGTSTAATSQTVSITTTVDNDWLVGWFTNDFGANTAGSNTTVRVNLTSRVLVDTNAAQTPAGSHSLQATDGGANNYLGLALAISPGTQAGVANGGFLRFM